jgi:hypothetical protein
MKSTTSLRARDGVALVMAMVAMAVLGALVAGVFFVALRDQRDGRDAVHRVQALAAAEYGLAAVFSPSVWRASWNLTTRRGLLETLAFGPGASVGDTVRLWKLDRNSLLLVSSGAAGPALSRAQRRIALLVALQIPRLASNSTVTVMNGASVADSSSISGFDFIPAGWSCPPLAGAPSVPAVAVALASLVDDSGCITMPCLAVAAAVAVDSAAAAVATYERFGGFDRDSIAAAAMQLPGDALLAASAPSLDASGECDASRPDNMGDPDRLLGAGSPCADHLPLLHAPGNMRIEGGAGQGFLLVDGNLTVSAGARFFGVVVVRGVLEVTERSEVSGAILASRVIVHDGSRARYSSCAVERALRAAAMTVVPTGLAWSEMY